jgi:CRISPR-associated endonuclease/helicase Cas3
MIRRRPSSNEALTVPAVPYASCPAKTYEDAHGNRQLGRSVLEHCLIVGELARALLQRLPESTRKKLFPPGSAVIAAVHDIGKVSPTFYCKLQKAVSKGRPGSFVGPESPLDERLWGGHAGVSALAVEAASGMPALGIIAGQHHGYTPETGFRGATDPVFGGEPWQQQRVYLIEALKEALQEPWPEVTGAAQLNRVLKNSHPCSWT